MAAGAVAAGSHVNGVELSIVIFFFVVVSAGGFLAAKWRQPDNPHSLDEWGLGGRGFGTVITWFLLGGDLYTAYTFVAVPAAMYATGGGLREACGAGAGFAGPLRRQHARTRS